jgi:hypothetical protein
MKRLITTLQILSIILSIISFFLIIYSFIFLLTPDSSVTIIKSIDNIYQALSTYSGIYKFTFIAFAFWATLRQLEISQKNYETTSGQIQFVQNDLNLKNHNEIKNETLKQCNYYLQDIQEAFKEYMETDKISSLPLHNIELKSYTNEMLRQSYGHLAGLIDKLDIPTKNNTIITLNKFEAFSALFIHGNLDKKLGRQLIGEAFTSQIGYLLGLISYFREDDDKIFCTNAIKLYHEWKV